MTLSINYLFKIPCIAFFVSFFFLSGCAPKGDTAALTVPPIKGLRVAVLPLENLTGRSVPLKEMKQLLTDKVKEFGVNVISDEALAKFMAAHRIRYTGGIDADTAGAFRDEEGVEAVIITSVELYEEEDTPKVGVISRLVSTDVLPVILWMDSVSLTGDDSPGILGLGLIGDPEELRDKAFGLLADSLEDFLSGEGDRLGIAKSKWRYRPRVYYRLSSLEARKTYSAAVMPFLNRSDYANAGEIVMLHFIDALHHEGSFNVFEPGVVRQRLLNMRVIMYGGISLSDSDLVANSLKSDLIVSGYVHDYKDYVGPANNPSVNFSVSVIDRMSKKVVWSSKSFNEGNDGVFFFDYGKLYTAGTLTSEMVRSIVKDMSGSGYWRNVRENETDFDVDLYR